MFVPLSLPTPGFYGNLWTWFSAYLHNRHQPVQISNSISEVLPVLSKVPQGSILGPLLLFSTSVTFNGYHFCSLMTPSVYMPPRLLMTPSVYILPRLLMTPSVYMPPRLLITPSVYMLPRLLMTSSVYMLPARLLLILIQWKRVSMQSVTSLCFVVNYAVLH